MSGLGRMAARHYVVVWLLEGGFRIRGYRARQEANAAAAAALAAASMPFVKVSTSQWLLLSGKSESCVI